MAGRGPLRLSQMEVYALHDLKAKIIDAVIDWEWSGTIPQQFFMPPTWLAGDSPSFIASQSYSKKYALFYQTLSSMADEAAAWEGHGGKKNMYQTLVDEWGPDLPRGLDFPVSIIPRHHYHLVLTYFFCVFPIYVRPFLLPRKFLDKFFGMDEAVGGVFSEAVRRRMEREDRYTTYLEERGLYTKEEMNPEDTEK
ncbi:hypothetical protein Sste5344_002461 [Sporothrix stenoceras]